MTTKANELINKLDEMVSQENTIETPFELGDTVTIIRDEIEYIAIVESVDGEQYTVRVQAIAGNEFEATDKVYVVTAEELQKYEHTKSFDIGDCVNWKSEAGDTIGRIVDKKERYHVEVYVKNNDTYEPTFVEVELDADILTKSDIELPLPKGKILFKADELKLEYSDEESKNLGILDGIGSAYGQVDLGGDTVKKGAYAQTLNHKEGKVPLFIDHGWDMATFVGVAHMSDSDIGLMVKAEMPLDATDVKNTFIKTMFAIHSGIDMGFSIGYDAVKSRMNADGTRELQEIKVYEISITPFPMDTNARILAARSKRIQYKSMQSKWATPSIDAPHGNQGEQGASIALAEVKSILNERKTNNE